MDKKMFRIHLIENSKLLADKFGHVCGTCTNDNKTKGGRCCSECASARGYLSDEEFDKVNDKYHFDASTLTHKGKGFLTPTGCALPREDRSEVCLGYWCGLWSDAAKVDPIITAKLEETRKLRWESYIQECKEKESARHSG